MKLAPRKTRLSAEEFQILDQFSDIHNIAQSVSEEANVPVDAMRSPSRLSRLCRARWLVMHHARLSGYSLEAIGAYFNRDHTTVLHGIRRVKKLMGEGATQ